MASLPGRWFSSDPDWRYSFLTGRAAPYVLLALATLLARASAWPVILIDPDEYAFILAAREVLNGHLPYTTMFDIKPVGPSLLLAIAMEISGRNLISVRIFGAACVFVTSVCLHEICLALSARRVEAFGAGLLYIAYSVLFAGLATMTEIMLAPFSAVGVLLLVRWYMPASTRARAVLAGCAGLAFGVAVSIKLVPVIPAFAAGAAAGTIALFTRRCGTGRLILHLALFLLGVVLPTALAASLYFLAGDFPLWRLSNFGFASLYMPKLPLHVALTKAATNVVTFWPLAVSAIIGLVAAAFRGAFACALVIVAGVWLAAEIIAAVLPGQMFPHYFLQTMPPLCLLAARGVSVVADAVCPRSVKLCFLMLASMVLVPALPASWDNIVQAARADPLRQVDAWLAQHRPPADGRMLVLSYDLLPEYFLSGLPLPARVAIPLHLFGPQRLLGRAAAGQPLAQELDQNPDLILLDKVGMYQDAWPEEIALIEGKLSSCYTQVARFPHFAVVKPGTYDYRDIVIFHRDDTAAKQCAPSTNCCRPAARP